MKVIVLLILQYRSLAGALQYVVLTRPDIAYAVNHVFQFMHAPTTVHLVALKRILRYLHGTITHGLVFCSSDRLSLVGYADANGDLILMIEDPLKGFVCVLVIRQCHGVLRNSKLSPGLQQKLSIEV